MRSSDSQGLLFNMVSSVEDIFPVIFGVVNRSCSLLGLLQHRNDVACHSLLLQTCVDHSWVPKDQTARLIMIVPKRATSATSSAMDILWPRMVIPEVYPPSVDDSAAWRRESTP